MARHAVDLDGGISGPQSAVGDESRQRARADRCAELGDFLQPWRSGRWPGAPGSGVPSGTRPGPGRCASRHTKCLGGQGYRRGPRRAFRRRTAVGPSPARGWSAAESAGWSRAHPTGCRRALAAVRRGWCPTVEWRTARRGPPAPARASARRCCARTASRRRHANTAVSRCTCPAGSSVPSMPATSPAISAASTTIPTATRLSRSGWANALRHNGFGTLPGSGIRPSSWASPNTSGDADQRFEFVHIAQRGAAGVQESLYVLRQR